MNTSKHWSEFERESPEIAGKGRQLLYQDSETASAFLATVAPDQGPRVHPIFPVLASGDLWLFIVNMSPKYRDLTRNQQFALHSLPTAEGGEEFSVRGFAFEVTESQTKINVVQATSHRQGRSDFEALFQCQLQSVLYTKWENWGTSEAWPSYTKWNVQ
jgi:hypothetical protein